MNTQEKAQYILKTVKYASDREICILYELIKGMRAS